MTAPSGYPSSGRAATDLAPPPAGPAPGAPPAESERPLFPIEQVLAANNPGDEVACPSCSALGTLQFAEETTRYWRGFGITDDGQVNVYDDTTADDGDDPRIDCTACAASWAIPVELELEYG